MNIALNGESRRLDSGTTLAELIRELDLAGKPVAVERNGETVPRGDLETTTMSEGDRVEIVTFVGGG